MNESELSPKETQEEPLSVNLEPATRPLPTHGSSWSDSQISIDNDKSPYLGVTLSNDMRRQQIRLFKNGDMITIKILGRDGVIHTLTGRASRKRTAYYRKADLNAIGLREHDTIVYSIASINGVPPQTSASQSNVPQPQQQPDNLPEASAAAAIGAPEESDATHLPDHELPHGLADTAPSNFPSNFQPGEDDRDWAR